MKFRLKIRFGFGFFKVHLNETNSIGGISSAKFGPVRCAARLWIRMVLPLGIKTFRIWSDIYGYDSMVMTPSVYRVPIDPGTVLTDFTMSFGFDLNENAKGMKFYNSNNLEGFMVDGKQDSSEKI